MGLSRRPWLEWIWTKGTKLLLGSQPEVEQWRTSSTGAGGRQQGMDWGHLSPPPAGEHSLLGLPQGVFWGLVLKRAEQ